MNKIVFISNFLVFCLGWLVVFIWGVDRSLPDQFWKIVMLTIYPEFIFSLLVKTAQNMVEPPIFWYRNAVFEHPVFSRVIHLDKLYGSDRVDLWFILSCF